MTREKRRLAAIVAADVVGYSRLMGRDESGTLARLREHRKERFEPALTRNGGRLVKLTGDGALAEFGSAVDAIRAAIEFQQAMADANRDQPEDSRIVFRVGLHLGDLIVDGDDLYGDGVNIAARLESAAPAGGIVVSRTVHEAVVGRLKATFADLGSLALKNIERPIGAFGVNWNARDWRVSAPATAASSAIATPQPADVPLTVPDKSSIAVLPFQNMSGDPEQEYFADGIVEDIITALSRFKSLFVIARNSSFTYKGRSPDIRHVGSELGVRYVLEGSVRKANGRVRITAQLIDSATGVHLWADRFDGSLEDVFELQDRVTTSVVGAVAPKVDQAEIERAKRKPVENPEAYDCYLRGMAKAHEQTPETWEEALRLFYRAIELDPNFATPYAMAARAYAARRQSSKVIDKVWEEAETRRLAARVSVIGRDDALALCWAGQTLAYMCGDCDTGAALVDQGLSINPNLAVGWQLRALISSWLGQHQVAIEQIARASRLNPKDPEAFRSENVIAVSLVLLGQYDEAITWATRSLAHLPTFNPAMRVLAVANALAGHSEEARRMMAGVRRAEPDLRMANLRDFLPPYRRPQDIEKLIEGARLAGLPE